MEVWKLSKEELILFANTLACTPNPSPSTTVILPAGHACSFASA